MAKGSDILLTVNPKGNFLEGYVTGTPKPGTCMEIDWSESAVQGRFYWEPFGTTAADGERGVGGDGHRRLVAVLLPDHLTGQAATTAYATGSRCFMYCPLPGDELNMIREDVSGTGDTQNVGDLFMIDDGTGKLIATSSAEAEPFMLLESDTSAPTADTLSWFMFTGY